MTTKQGYQFGWFLFGLTALFYCYEYLLRIAPSVMSQELMQYYSLNATAFGSFFAVYYYIYTPMQIPVGLLFDRYGSRFLLTLATLICAVGTFIFACSHLLWIAQLGRFLIGFGSAFAFVGVLKVASEWLPPDRFGMIAGMTTSLGMVGAMFGDNIMAILVKEWGWQATMYLSAIFGLVLTAIIWRYIKDARPGHAHTASASSSLSFKTLLGEVGLLLKKRQMWLIAFIGGILYSSLSVFAELWGVPYFQQAKGLSPQLAAAVVSMVFVGWAVGGPIVGFFSDYLNNRRFPLILGSVLGAASIAAVTYIDGMSLFTIGLLLFLFGVFSSTENIVFVIAKESTIPSLTGTAIALTNMFVMLVGTILQPFVGYILDLLWDGSMTNGINHYSNSNFHYALLILPIAYLFSAALSLLLQESYVPSKEEKLATVPAALAVE
jgi:MFS family permease